MKGLLSGHLAVVTGAGSGIGRAVALGYAEAGAAVIAADLNAGTAEETAAAVRAGGGRGWGFGLDVTDRAACRDLAARVAAEIGQVSILVNNAGIVRRGLVTDATADADWDATLAVNLDGPYNATMAFLPALRETRGRIVNLGSIQSFVHTGNSAAYTATKAGVRGLTAALAAELAPFGIRVNAIGPGLIRTPLNAEAIANNPAMLDRFMAHTPLGRPGTPADIVGPAVFLASDMSAYVTGVLLPVDGGYLTV